MRFLDHLNMSVGYTVIKDCSPSPGSSSESRLLDIVLAFGVPRHLCNPHISKHTIAMEVIHSAGIENVRQYLGHKSISSTGAYLKVSDADPRRW